MNERIMKPGCPKSFGKRVRTAVQRRMTIAALAALQAVALTFAACDREPVVPVPEPKTTAFVHVEVVTMTDEQVLHDRTVIVHDGRIVSVEPAETAKTPEEALVIEGNGGYLLPGLSDMHAHLPQYGSLPIAFLASGVTTVRNMNDYHDRAPRFAAGLFALFGVPVENVDVLLLKKLTAAGTVPGPRIYTAGNTLNSPEKSSWPGLLGIKDAKQARQEVGRQAKAGYDFIKVYTDLAPEVYRAIVEEAAGLGIPVAGHVPESIGYRGMIELGGQKSVEHIDGTVNTAGGDLREAGRSYAESGIWFCPTLIVSTVMYPGETATTAGEYVSILSALRERHEGRKEMKYIDRRLTADWRKNVEGWKERSLKLGASMRNLIRAATPAAGKELVSRYREHGGARLLTGTDAPTHYVLPGFSLLEEFLLLRECGWSEREILRASSVNAAEFFGEADERGTIEAGKQADLILTERNPLEDLAALETLRGTMVDGRWYERALLLEQLEETARR